MKFIPRHVSLLETNRPNHVLLTSLQRLFMASYDYTDHAPRLHEPVVHFTTGIMMVKQIFMKCQFHAPINMLPTVLA